MYFTAPILMAILISLFSSTHSFAIEEAKYRIVEKDDNIEVRDYSPSIVAETMVDGSLENAGKKAFSRLFGYISGDNRSRRKVAMTSPVSQQAESQKIEMTAPVSQKRSRGKWIVSFMMPSSYTMQTLPTPEDPDVRLRQISTRKMVAIRYSGTWSEERYTKYKQTLETWIVKNGLKIAGDPVWARYNSPFTLWFSRRNEILIPVE